MKKGLMNRYALPFRPTCRNMPLRATVTLLPASRDARLIRDASLLSTPPSRDGARKKAGPGAGPARTTLFLLLRRLHGFRLCLLQSLLHRHLAGEDGSSSLPEGWSGSACTGAGSSRWPEPVGVICANSL